MKFAKVIDKNTNREAYINPRLVAGVGYAHSGDTVYVVMIGGGEPFPVEGTLEDIVKLIEKQSNLA